MLDNRSKQATVTRDQAVMTLEISVDMEAPDITSRELTSKLSPKYSQGTMIEDGFTQAVTMGEIPGAKEALDPTSIQTTSRVLRRISLLRFNQTAMVISLDQALMIAETSAARAMLDTISMEVTSQWFRQIRLLFLGTHIQLLRLGGKVAQILPARKHL